jgi:hypothetical protein
MPGGGVGIFDGCVVEYGSSLPGAQYGGISTESQCDSFPEVLQAGCQWRFGWFGDSDNPGVTFQQVQCPAEIVAKSGCLRDDDSSFPAFVTPTGSSAASSATSTTTVAYTTGTTTTTTTSAATTTSASSGGAAQYAQCGGDGWTGVTTCASPYTCVVVNQYYSQCQ